VKYLLDTNVLSEPLKSRPSPECIAWLESREPEALATTAISLGEIWQGIHGLARHDKRRIALTAYAKDVPRAFRVLSFDERAARKWGDLTSRGRPLLPVIDSLIAAIALSRNLTIATRD
jgi:toxin FitB